jgi:transcriptional regulator with XRE-family HTH domain
VAVNSLHVAVGRAIREFRTEKRLSQERLADKAGLHRTYLGGVERGERNVSLYNIDRISDALGLDPADLLDRARTRAP